MLFGDNLSYSQIMQSLETVDSRLQHRVNPCIYKHENLQNAQRNGKVF